MREIYTRSMEHNASDAYMINARTRLLDCERLRKAIIVHTFKRRFLDKYRCVDTPLQPITLNRFTLHGGLIYYKRNQYDWKTISLDEVTAIYEA